MNDDELKHVVEAAIFAAGHALSVDDILELFEDRDWTPSRKDVKQALDALADDWQGRGIELKEVASGYRFQVRQSYSGWLGRLWAERPPRYTRALLETLALIAYRQPITRGEIEEVRGVSVSPSIVKTLLERQWIRVLGHRDVPGRPELFGTTREFLDSFNLKTLDELPPLSEIQDLDRIGDDLFAEVLPASAELPAGDPGDDAARDADADQDVDADAEIDEDASSGAGRAAGAAD